MDMFCYREEPQPGKGIWDEKIPEFLVLIICNLLYRTSVSDYKKCQRQIAPWQ
jgi:hypothetical protein